MGAVGLRVAQPPPCTTHLIQLEVGWSVRWGTGEVWKGQRGSIAWRDQETMVGVCKGVYTPLCKGWPLGKVGRTAST